MLLRSSALIISIFYIQGGAFQRNGTNNFPSGVINRTFSLNSQGNNFQNRMNQLLKNQPKIMQQFDQARNLQQTFNLPQATNAQNLNSQSSLNLVQPNSQQTQPAYFGHQVTNLQQSALLQQQQPLSSQQGPNALISNNYQQNVNSQQQNQNLANLQVLRQASDISTLPNAQFSQAIDPTNPTSNPSVIPAAITAYTSQVNPCDSSSPSGLVSIVYPQNQQVSYSGAPPYFLDLSQVTNNIPTSMSSPTFTTLNNPPSVVTILTATQQSTDPIAVQSPTVQSSTDPPNQITIIKSVQPYPPVQPAPNQDPNAVNGVTSANLNVINSVPNQDPNIINTVLYPGLPAPPPNAQSTNQPSVNTIPSLNSLIASTLTNQAYKSSNMRTLLPLILDLLKERNNCGCQHQCGCQNNMPPMPDRGAVVNSGAIWNNSNQNDLPEYNSIPLDDDSEEFDIKGSFESRRNGNRNGKRKIKPLSEEYDYSEEQQDD